MCVCRVFSRVHIQEAEVLSVRFPKEYGHINLAAKQSIPSCVHISFKTLLIMFLQSIYPYISIHTYISTYVHMY